MAKMVKATAKTEFARVELLKRRLTEGMPGVTQDMVDRALASAKSLLELEMKNSVSKFMSKYGAEDWYKAARACYDVVEENYQFRIISNTRGWNNAPEWVMGSKWEAEDKINQLILWKEYDRRRGIGNMERDVERMQQKMREMELEEA